jgi:hypothetical protein
MLNIGGINLLNTLVFLAKIFEQVLNITADIK